jgi:glycosyltransferase involved in cell wall biosynthesis
MKIYYNGRFLTQRLTGVQRYSHEVLGAWDRMLEKSPALRERISITVLAPRDGHLYKPNWKHIELRYVGKHSGYLWEQTELPAALDGPLFCPGNTAPILSLLSGNPVVVTVHDLSYRYFPSAYSRKFRVAYGLIMPFVFRFARKIFTVTDSERQMMGRCYPGALGRIVPIIPGSFSPLVLEQIPGILAQPSERPYVLYVGSITKRKNVQGVLDVALEMVRNTELSFFFVGDISKSFIQPNLSVPEEFRDRIRFLGRIDDAELISWYKGAACLVFPSFYESFGSPPVEAMTCGCPVIVSDIPALREVGGDAVLYCDPHDRTSIILAIRRLTEDLNLNAEMRALGTARAARYSWENCARTLLESIEATCSSS